jgi:bifunctional ADP-heptose synthase (sugar kinase/adenylyltransferase)
MTLFRKNQVSHVGAQAREVFDVSGAGDTVIGVMAVALAASWDWDLAMALANRAGGIVVGKLGTATVSWEELR